MGSRASDRERMDAAEPPEQPLHLAPPLFRTRAGRPKSGPYHDAVPPELADELHLYVGKGLALIGVDENTPAELVVDALAAYIDELGRGERAADDEQRLALACAYGHELCRWLGWSWAHLRRAPRPGIVVMSPDRRYVTGPRAVVDACLDRDRRGARLVAHARRLRDSDELPASEPGRYLRVPLER